MSSQFNVCSFNVGGSSNDYRFLCRHLGTAPQQMGQKEEIDRQEAAFAVQYNRVQEATSELISNLADVYCLQEVANADRPLIRALAEKNFETIRFEGVGPFDTAIVLDRARFRDITNHSMSVLIDQRQRWRQDVAIATATDIQTGERVTFVSAHSPGFDYTIPNLNNCPDTRNGDIYCRAIASKLAEIGGSAIEIIGSDMNANPERWNPRFAIFPEFQVNRNGFPTNVNPNDGRYAPQYAEREIDFILTRVIISIWEQIKAIFCSYFQNTAAINHQNPFGFDDSTNCSDHLPVFISVTSTATDSKISQLWSAISSYFVPAEPSALAE